MNKSYQDYKDLETVICQSPSSGANGGSGGGRTEDGGEDEDDDKVEVEVPGGCSEPT